MGLTLDEANRIAQGAIAKAEEFGIKITVAVCDEGGRLMVLNRMDGAHWAGVYGSQGKCTASAAFKKRSGELEPQAENPALRSIITALGQHIILRQGGVPLVRNGGVDAGIGVGGGTPEQDEMCSQAGADAVS